MNKKRITSFDVARRSGVSRTTVSFVLNDVPNTHISSETRQRVLDCAKELGYHPNSAGRKLASGRTNTLGLVLRQSREQVFSDALLPQVVLGVGQAAELQGYQILLKPIAPDDPDGYVRLIQENHVDGIILSGPQQNDLEIVKLFEEGFPVILMGQLPDSHLPCVDIDAIAGAELAIQHLIEYGHRRIAMITNAPLEYTSAEQRHYGYTKAMREAGVDVEAGYLKEGNYTPESGYEAMRQLLQLTQRPTAVFIASDVVAMGAIQAIKEAGLRIPEDVSVVGFDDIPLAAYIDPPLTTIRTPSYGIGWAAGENLIHLIKGKQLDQSETILEPEVVVRKSSSFCC